MGDEMNFFELLVVFQLGMVIAILLDISKKLK